MPNLEALYKFRFQESALPQKRQIWRTLCRHYFQDLIGRDQAVLDLACGYGEFINNIEAKAKYGVDLNPASRSHLNADVDFKAAPAHKLPLDNACLDVVFTSNFLEHLRDKEECDAVFAEVWRVLRPNGRFIVMGPNIRYAGARYWDFYDHSLPLSHLSLEEGLEQSGFACERVIGRFLPFSTRSALPKASWLIAAYLKLPLFWPLFGRQFLVVARKAYRTGRG